MYAQRIGKLSPMMETVFDNVPDDPLAGESSLASLKSLLEVDRCPSIKSPIDPLPGRLKPID
jgi:hypothetical protein